MASYATCCSLFVLSAFRREVTKRHNEAIATKSTEGVSETKTSGSIMLENVTTTLFVLYQTANWPIKTQNSEQFSSNRKVVVTAMWYTN